MTYILKGCKDEFSHIHLEYLKAFRKQEQIQVLSDQWKHLILLISLNSLNSLNGKQGTYAFFLLFGFVYLCFLHSICFSIIIYVLALFTYLYDNFLICWSTDFLLQLVIVLKNHFLTTSFYKPIVSIYIKYLSSILFETLYLKVHPLISVPLHLFKFYIFKHNTFHNVCNTLITKQLIRRYKLSINSLEIFLNVHLGNDELLNLINDELLNYSFNSRFVIKKQRVNPFLVMIHIAENKSNYQTRIDWFPLVLLMVCYYSYMNFEKCSQIPIIIYM